MRIPFRSPASTPVLTPARLVLATVVVAAAAAFTLTAQAQPPGPPAGGPMPMMMMPGGPHLDRMLDAVNASPEQRSQLKAIFDGARSDLQAQRDAGRTLQDEMAALFTQPTVDARAAEVLRQKMLAQHDAASKRSMQAMLDASRVLTVEQRQTLAARMAEQRKQMERHHAERQASAPTR